MWNVGWVASIHVGYLASRGGPRSPGGGFEVLRPRSVLYTDTVACTDPKVGFGGVVLRWGALRVGMGSWFLGFR